MGARTRRIATFTTNPPLAGVLAGAGEPAAGLVAAPSADGPESYYTVDAADGHKYLTLAVEKAPGAASPVVEVSDNLTDWFSGSSHTTVLVDDAGILKVRDNTPLTSGVKRYIRVKP